MKNNFLIVIFLLHSTTLFAQQAPEGLFINSKAPDFKLKDQHGKEVRLREVIKKKKAVIVFYRGYWDPACIKELKAFQDSLTFITEQGGEVIAITPENWNSIDSTIEKTGAQFSILHDEQIKMMKAYELEYELSEKDINRQKQGGIHLETINGKEWKYLPVPAVYIVNKDQNITYRFFNTNARRRPSVSEILQNLK